MNQPDPIHTIRLRRPWNRRIGDAVNRVDVPDQPVPLAVGDVVRYERSFNCPTGIDFASVTLRIESIQAALADIELNGHALARCQPPDGCILCDLTKYLRPTNRLAITLSASSPDSTVCLSGAVTLEIGPRDRSESEC